MLVRSGWEINHSEVVLLHLVLFSVAKRWGAALSPDICHMINPASSKIRRCSECFGLVMEIYPVSMCLIGMKYWTDFGTTGLSYYIQRSVVRCPHCDGVLLMDAQEVVGEAFAEDGPDWEMAERGEYPEVGDYFRLLRRNPLLITNKKDFRLEAWRRGNDERRYGPRLPPLSEELFTELEKLARKFLEAGARDWNREAAQELGLKYLDPPPLSPDEAVNLCQLLVLFDESDGFELMCKAEALRELSRFDEAIELVSRPVPKEFRRWAAFIRELAERRDPMVTKFTWDIQEDFLP